MFGIVLLVLSSEAQGATISSTATGGLWSDPKTWIGGILPTEDDTVKISGSVTLDQDIKIAGITIPAGKTLFGNSGALLSLTKDSLISGSVLSSDGSIFKMSFDGTFRSTGRMENVDLSSSGTLQVSGISNSLSVQLIGKTIIKGGTYMNIDFNEQELALNSVHIYTRDLSGSGNII